MPINPYRQVFAAPGTVPVALAGAVARTGHFMTLLGAVLFVSATTGSFGLAGAVSAGYALAYAAISPVTSRLVDRFGCRRVLVPATVGTGCARVAMLVAAWWHAPAWALVALAAAAGGSMPAVGSLVRARWSRLYRGSPLLHPALSFESVIEETILVVGPVAVAALAGYVDPSAGLIAAVVLAVSGLAALAVAWKGDVPGSAATRSGDAATRSGDAAGGPLALLAPLLVAFAAVAVATITVEVAIVASAQPATAGWILATMASGSALCGLWYGARRWRRPPHDRLMWTLVLLAVGSLGFVAAPNVAALFAAAALFGITLAPAFIDGFAMAHDTVSAHRLTEGLTWMTTAAGIGIAVGSATAGQVLDARGTTVTFLLATGFAVAAVPIAWLAAARIRCRRRSPDGRQHGMSEVSLPGGRTTGAVRIGDVVHKPAAPWTPTVHEVLRHLEKHGFAGAPRALGIDGRGREMLTYLAGETIGDRFPWPDWVYAEPTLVQVGRWLRQVHDLTADFEPPADARWFTGSTMRPGWVVGHQDASPYNAVMDGDRLIGFVDWDIASPSPREVDIAFSAIVWVPLAPAPGLDVDRRRRFHLLLDAYGYDGDRHVFATVIPQRASRQAGVIREMAGNGHPASVALLPTAELLSRAASDVEALPPHFWTP